MKEDILEQLVDDYLQSKGYFTRHNIKFRPRSSHPDFVRNHDSNHSDIDVIGFHPKKTGPDCVWAVSCKSWQSGFRVKSKLEELTKNKKRSGREAWQFFRELMNPKWSEAFIDAVDATTGTREFTYVLAVTAIIGERQLWENHPPFKEAMGGNPIRIIELSEIIEHLQEVCTTTVASSEIGRLLQLMRAARKSKYQIIPDIKSQEST
jgi:hypothetical protein